MAGFSINYKIISNVFDFPKVKTINKLLQTEDDRRCVKKLYKMFNTNNVQATVITIRISNRIINITAQ